MRDYGANTLQPGGVLSHFPGRQWLVRDSGGSDADRDMLLRARIRSGDYFETLATELDRIAQALPEEHIAEINEIERIVAELIRANKGYRVTPKQV